MDSGDFPSLGPAGTPLLTWAGEVQPQTRIAVIVQDNRPTLIIDGEVVRLLVLHTNATVDDFLSRHSEVGRPQARDTDGRWHTIGLDTLRIAQAAYDKALASDTASALLNSTTTLVLPDGLGNATFTQAALLEAAQRLATNELAVAQDSRGDWWLSASTHQWLLREAAQEQWTTCWVMGGDDTYRINTAGMSITAGDGRALIELGIDALNTELNLGDGHRAQLHVKAPTAIASADEPPATVLARIDGGAHNTWIDASDANVELHVVAMDGWGTIQMGGLTRVTVGQDMDRLDIQCGQHAQWKELYIEMGDPGFDFDQLITADGQQGKFLKTVVDGQEVYETRWYHASGGYTELRYTGHESDNVEIAALNGTFVRPLDDLVASPLAHS